MVMVRQAGLDRRGFLKGAGMTGLTLGLGSDLTIGLGGSAAAQAAAPARDFGAVRQLMDLALERSVVPGCSMIVGGPDGIIHQDVAGAADGAGTALRADHLYRIYSMTKPVTSALALMLVEAGILELDQPVGQWLPAFAEARVYQGGDTLETLQTVPPERPVTVRDLLRHTAGLTYRGADTPVARLYAWRGIDNGSGETITSMDGSPNPQTLAEFAAKLATIPLREQPGTRFTYGNATDVLGAVIEAATGQRLGAVMRARIFEPLGMSNTAFTAVDPARLTAAWVGRSPRQLPNILDTTDLSGLGRNELVLVDSPATSPFARNRPIDFGGAGLVASMQDYLVFARMLANGGQVNGTRLLTEESVRLISTNALPEAALQSPTLQRLGLGFGLGAAMYLDPQKVPAGIPPGVFFWGGAASTFFWADPQNQIGGVIMAQVFGGDFRAYHIGMIQAFYRALG